MILFAGYEIKSRGRMSLFQKQIYMKAFWKTLCVFAWMTSGVCAQNVQHFTAEQIEARRDSILQLISGAQTEGLKMMNITTFGARGDGKKDCKPAFDKAMARAAKTGGLHLVVPAGEYLLNGPIHLVSNVCLELQEGATLKFSSNPQYYLPMVKTSWEGTFVQNYSPFIYGYQVSNVTIKGKGTIDGNAEETFGQWKSRQKNAQQLSRKMNHEQTPVSERNFGEGYYLRPHLIQFYDCSAITLEDVFMTRSPFWCIHLLQCENVVCRGLRYDAKLINNDGIDPEYSRNVLIEQIQFNNGDDNVAIKCGRDDDGRQANRPSGGIIIRNCLFKGLHGVVLGSEMSSGIEDVYIEDCTYGGYCKRGIYMKTNPDRGGFIRNIFVNRCTFGEVEDLFYITSKYAGEGLNNVHFTDIHDVYVSRLSCEKARKNAIVLQGTQKSPLRRIFFDRVNVNQAGVGLSMSDALSVEFTDCNLGGYVDVPTSISEKDHIFGQDK
jgi:polygalacturonase